MKAFPIPVVALGPGSQEFAGEEAPDCPALPQGMSTFAAPRLPETADPGALAETLAFLGRLLEAMRGTRFGTDAYPSLDLRVLSPAARRLVDDALGEGEVSARVAGAPALRIQESVFAGIWRVQEVDAAGQLLADRVEACAAPAVIAARAREAAGPEVEAVVPPAGVMNAPAVLTEVLHAAGRFRAEGTPHVVNLTLLPLLPADVEHLGRVLGAGCAVILSRGYGNCRITSTALSDTWWVQYYNSNDTLILNTIEIATVPEVALASAEDFVDSAERLAEWIEALAHA